MVILVSRLRQKSKVQRSHSISFTIKASGLRIMMAIKVNSNPLLWSEMVMVVIDLTTSGKTQGALTLVLVKQMMTIV